MNDAERKADELLLYDPLFETPPDTVIRDTPGKGFFGKAVVKKTVFVAVLALFVGVSIALSFHSLTKSRFYYEETEGGWMLTEFNANKTDAVLEVGPVFAEDGSVEPGKTVVAVKQFAVCCNETTSFILIGKDVREIPNTAFYSCTSLRAVIVDEENPWFCSVDGVLYRKENGSATELMLYPAHNDIYRAMLLLGEQAPTDAKEAADFAARAAALEKTRAKWLDAQNKNYPAQGDFDLSDEQISAFAACLKYEILPGVSRIGEMALAECKTLFEVTLPEGVRDIETMAFFKCVNLRSFNIPDTVETIGSDAFSYCDKVPYIFVPASVQSIGHHAFYGCDGVDEIQMECDENSAPETGQNWLPKHRKVFLRNVPVVYGCERRDG